MYMKYIQPFARAKERERDMYPIARFPNFQGCKYFTINSG